MLRSVLLSTLLLACAPKRVELRYRTDEALNRDADGKAQPLLVGLYPLSGTPAQLQDALRGARCGLLRDEAAVVALAGEALVATPPPLSAVPSLPEWQIVTFDRPKEARYLLMVPFQDRKCDAGEAETDWALVRLTRFRRTVWLDMNQRSLTLADGEHTPNGTAIRQIGCVEGEANASKVPTCR